MSENAVNQRGLPLQQHPQCGAGAAMQPPTNAGGARLPQARPCPPLTSSLCLARPVLPPCTAQSAECAGAHRLPQCLLPVDSPRLVSVPSPLKKERLKRSGVMSLKNTAIFLASWFLMYDAMAAAAAACAQRGWRCCCCGALGCDLSAAREPPLCSGRCLQLPHSLANTHYQSHRYVPGTPLRCWGHRAQPPHCLQKICFAFCTFLFFSLPLRLSVTNSLVPPAGG